MKRLFHTICGTVLKRAHFGLLASLMVVAQFTTLPVHATGLTINTYPVPYANAQPGSITKGPDGALWFTDYQNSNIVRIDTSGNVTKYDTGSAGAPAPSSITSGPDGALWFTPDAAAIGRITTSGVVTVYPTPNNAFPSSITSGPDGALWFTCSMFATGGCVGRTTIDGQTTIYRRVLGGVIHPVRSSPGYMTAGLDGTLWYAEAANNSIARMTTANPNDATYFPSVNPDGAGVIGNLVAGSDGNIWFTDQISDSVHNAKIGKIATDGQMTEYDVPGVVSGISYIDNMTQGPDNALWFTVGRYDSTTDKYEYEIGRMTMDGSVNLYPLDEQTPSDIGYAIGGITTGPDNNLWFTVPFTRADSSGYGNVNQIVLTPPDATAPTLGSPTWSANPLLHSQSTMLSIPASDDGSGLASVKYTVDGGSPADMTYDSAANIWKATFGSSLAAGTYNIAVTATDQAGNSSVANDVLAVYNPANGYVTGHSKSVPTAADTLPIARDTSNNPTKLIVGFTNVTAPASGSFDVDYTVKNKKDAFNISSTGIDWVVVQDSTHASILGHGDLTTYVNGVKAVMSNVSVRFNITLGTNGAADHIEMKIYNPGVDPNTGSPAYTVSDDVLASGSNLMIHP